MGGSEIFTWHQTDTKRLAQFVTICFCTQDDLDRNPERNSEETDIKVNGVLCIMQINNVLRPSIFSPQADRPGAIGMVRLPSA